MATYGNTDAVTARLSAKRPRVLLLLLFLAPPLLCWLYPVSAMAIVLLWHALSYFLSRAGSWALASNVYDWCENRNFFSLFPTLLDGSHKCATHGAQGLFAFNPVAAVLAVIVVLILTLVGFRKFERMLTRSSGYVTARHIWRCALPACLFLVWLCASHHTDVITLVGQSGIALIIVALCHFFFQHRPSVTTRAPPPARHMYLIGGACAAALVILLNVTAIRWLFSAPTGAGASMEARLQPVYALRDIANAVGKSKVLEAPPKHNSRAVTDAVDRVPKMRGSGLGSAGDVGSGFDSMGDAGSTGVAVPAADNSP